MIHYENNINKVEDIKQLLKFIGFEYDEGSAEYYYEFTYNNELIVIYYDEISSKFVVSDKTYLIWYPSIVENDREGDISKTQYIIYGLNNIMPFLNEKYKTIIRKNKLVRLLGNNK